MNFNKLVSTPNKLKSSRLNKVCINFSILFAIHLACLACEEGSKTPLDEPVEIPLDGPWAVYQTTAPNEDLNTFLVDTPYIYPTTDCKPLSELPELPETAQITVNDSGEELICVWNSPIATAPEGIAFNEIGSCEDVFTMAPSWYVAPERLYPSELGLLEDEVFKTELDWAQTQINSSGCACCHSSQINSGHVSAWDAGAPAVWTDTISNARLYLLSGMIEEHQEFGAFSPDQSHGASRSEVMIPSTDPMRLRNFFLSEFERRGGSLDDQQDALRQMEALFSRKSAQPRPCIDPFEGIIDGKLTWNGDGQGRQFYIQELESEVPGFPPNLDRPAGTVWAFRIPANEDALNSGSVSLGELPDGAVQLVPANGELPTFESGRSYRMFVTPDVMLLNLTNCTFEAP